MVYMRGHPNDYDTWRDSGLEGWGVRDVLPYFRRSEAHSSRGAMQSPAALASSGYARGRVPVAKTILSKGSSRSPEISSTVHSSIFATWEFSRHVIPLSDGRLRISANSRVNVNAEAPQNCSVVATVTADTEGSSASFSVSDIAGHPPSSPMISTRPTADLVPSKMSRPCARSCAPLLADGGYLTLLGRKVAISGKIIKMPTATIISRKKGTAPREMKTISRLVIP